MSYSVKQLADLANISVRTLHYYDEIDLLKPSFIEKNGYRKYERKELLKLQQILFFRELDFSVEEIKRIMSNPRYSTTSALLDQRSMLELKRKRISGLIKTINQTLKELNKESNMADKEIYHGFDDHQMKEYAEEAKQRWGHTDAYKQSQERYAKMSKKDIAKLKRDSDTFMKRVAETADQGATSEAMQELIAEHYNSLRTWYEPNLEMYRGLANMYVDDPRFNAHYEKYKPGLAEIMRDAMLHYADSQKS